MRRLNWGPDKNGQIKRASYFAAFIITEESYELLFFKRLASSKEIFPLGWDIVKKYTDDSKTMAEIYRRSPQATYGNDHCDKWQREYHNSWKAVFILRILFPFDFQINYICNANLKKKLFFSVIAE